jgi:hypothetical protein
MTAGEVQTCSCRAGKHRLHLGEHAEGFLARLVVCIVWQDAAQCLEEDLKFPKVIRYGDKRRGNCVRWYTRVVRLIVQNAGEDDTS